MGFRFFKRLNILPGVTLNLSKSGGSVSVGPRGAKFTLGSQGSRITLGIPGTGLFYTTTFSLGKLGRLFGQSSKSPEASDSTEVSASAEISPVETSLPPPQRHKLVAQENDRLTPGFFERLSTPDDQKALADGCQALARGDEATAFARLQEATHLADGAFLAGVLAFKKGRCEDATRYLTAAAGQEQGLGRYLANYVSSLMTSRTQKSHDIVNSLIGQKSHDIAD